MSGNALPQIQDLLPHGKQCLNIDDLTQHEPGEQAEGLWLPGQERFGKVLDRLQIIEALAQTACAAAASADPTSERQVVLFAGIPEATFTPQTIPADEVVKLAMKLVKVDGSVKSFSGSASINGEEICAATISGRPAREAQFNSLLKRAQVGQPETEVEEGDGSDSEYIDHGGIYVAYNDFLRFDLENGTGETLYTPTAANFRGHFPGGRHILQGVQQVGALVSLANRHLAITNEELSLNHQLQLIGIRPTSFKNMVLPGQTLKLQVQRQPDEADNCVYSGAAYVGETMVCESTVLFLMSR